MKNCNKKTDSSKNLKLEAIHDLITSFLSLITLLSTRSIKTRCFVHVDSHIVRILIFNFLTTSFQTKAIARLSLHKAVYLMKENDTYSQC